MDQKADQIERRSDEEQPVPTAPEEEARKRRRRRRIILLVLLVLIVIGMAIGIPYYLYSRAHQTTDDAFIDGHISVISARVAGHVIMISAEDNRQVNQGDTLVELDPSDFQARLQAAQAALAAAQAVAAQAQAEVVAAEAQARRDHVDLRRYQELVAGSAATKQQLDHAVAQAETSNANLAAMRKRTATADAQVQQAQAALEQARLELSYTRVCAPIDGWVTHRTVELGAYVQPGQALLAVVSPDMWVTANFKETQLTKMVPGQSVSIHVDAYPGYSFAGHVDSVQFGSGARFSLLPPENATGNYIKVVQRVPVKILFDDPLDFERYHIAPGMSVVPDVNVAQRPQEQASAAATSPSKPPATQGHAYGAR